MKAKELRELGDDQLKEKLEELNGNLFDYRFKAKMGSLENPSVIPAAKKDIARINTILTERKGA